VSHSEIACRLIAELPPGVFAHAARDGVIHHDFIMLERLLPGVRFAVDKVDVDEWQLVGACEDGSVITWLVGA
jgi:hypothetical protein